MPEKRDAAAGYVGDIEGSVLRTGTGECVRSGDWTLGRTSADLAGDVQRLTLAAVVEQTGYAAELQASDDPQDETRLDNLGELESVAAEFARDTRPGA